MSDPRRGSSIIGLVVFIVLWLVAIIVVVMGHNKLSGLTDEAKKSSLEAELKAKLNIEPQERHVKLREVEDLEALFHKRDTLRKEVTYLGRLLGFGFNPLPEGQDETSFQLVLTKAKDRMNEFRVKSDTGLPHFQEGTKRVAVEELYDADKGEGTNFFTKYDILLSWLVQRLERLEDQLAYYKALRQLAEDTVARAMSVPGAVRDGITASDPAWQGLDKLTPGDLPGRPSYQRGVDDERAEYETRYLKPGAAGSIEEAETRSVVQMTEYVMGVVDGKIAEYQQLATEEETKLDQAVQAFKTERNALGSQIKTVVKERHRGREVTDQIRITPPIPVAERDPSEGAPSMADEGADGEIVTVNPETDECYLNIGEDEGVAEGMSFGVYRQGPGREWNYRGKVQVKEVLPKMSVVSIVDQVSRFDPISAGDSVFNKIFNAADAVHITFLGELPEQDQARYRHLVERIGGRIDAEVTVLTDYVILLPEYEKHSGSKANIERAKEVGVRGMTLDELRLYIEY